MAETTTLDEIRAAAEREFLPPIPETREVRVNLPDGRFYLAHATVETRLIETKEVLVSNGHGPIRVPFAHGNPTMPDFFEVTAEPHLFIGRDQKRHWVWIGYVDRWFKDEHGLERIVERTVVYGRER